jgi:hypothetical protein
MKNCSLRLQQNFTLLVVMILCAFSTLLIPSAASAEGEACIWKRTSGEAIAEGISPEETMTLARNRARLKVAEEVAGVTVLGSSMVKENTMVSDLISTLSRGSVTTCRNESWKEELIPAATGQGRLPQYRLEMECCVAVDKGEADPFFSLSVKTSKPAYSDGDEIVLDIRSGKDSYLTLFHLGSDNKATLLLPNNFQKAVQLTHGKSFSFPGNGMAMKARNTPGKKKEVEHFVAIATKEWLDIKGVASSEKGITDPAQLFTAITAIPANARAVSITSYEIHTGR